MDNLTKAVDFKEMIRLNRYQLALHRSNRHLRHKATTTHLLEGIRYYRGLLKALEGSVRRELYRYNMQQ